jgi:hypothetical protein
MQTRQASFFVPFFMAGALLTACGQAPESGSAEVQAAYGQCNYAALAQCLSHKGGQGCYPKHGCEAGSVSQRGAQYAATASSREGHPLAGYCYQYVWEHLSNVVGPDRANRSSAGAESAFMFADWANRSPGQLRSIFELQKISVSRIVDIPVGSVIVWARGQCGYSSEHGHIEIVTRPGRACSDGCAPIKNCGSMPDVCAPL